MANIIGIDLGTTNSVMARLDEMGNPIIVHNKEGANVTPSVVEIDGETVLVGLEPKKSARFKQNIFFEFKREMGSSKKYEIEDKSFTPTELSSFVLKKMLNDANEKIGEIAEVIITTPANFTNEARAATIEAGSLAGYEVKHIINEPTAAALFYSYEKKLASGKYAVYDLGGGTFDLSLVEIIGTEIEVISSLGVASLGGKDFDLKLENLIIENIKKQSPDYVFEPSDFDPEEVKISLSKREEVLLRINRNNIKVTRQEFETSISSLLLQAEMCCENVLKEAKLDKSELSGILLVGGSSRIPAVKRSVTEIFNKEPISSVNPDEVVTLGAALYSGIKADPANLNTVQQEVVSNIILKEVTNHYFGTIANVYDEQTGQFLIGNTIIIDKNTPIPSSQTKSYFTSIDGQIIVSLKVTQSTTPEKDPRFVKVIWEGELGELPPNRPAGQQIDVTFVYDENERMFCEFKDVKSNKDINVDLSIKQSSNEENSDEEIERFIIE